MKRVVIVGGGITGLAAAHALEHSGLDCDIRLIESESRLGGNIRTVNHNGFTIDAGPDSWVAAKPHATRLAREVGLGDELIGTRPDTRKVYIVWKKQLHPMPEGLILGIPTEVRPFVATDLLSLDAKLRAGLEPFVPKRDWSGGADESIASFIGRRLGPEICERIAGPLLGGIFAGDPEALSVRACVPQLVEAEAKHGSLIMAMRELRAKRRKAAGAGEGEASAFLSLTRGMGDLVLNLAYKLRRTDVTKSTSVRRVARLEPNDARGRWAVEIQGETIFADDVVLTVPAHAASRMLEEVDASLSALLGTVEYVSTATVFLAYKRYDVRHPLDSVGFLIPRAEGRPILAGTFVSSKWEHRAPAGHVLIRVFIGGAGGERFLEGDDDHLVRVAREQLLDLIGIEAPPVFTKTFRFRKASPQPHVGHLVKMDRIFAKVRGLPGLHVGGNGYIGSGIPDAIRQGEEIATRIVR